MTTSPLQKHLTNKLTPLINGDEYFEPVLAFINQYVGTPRTTYCHNVYHEFASQASITGGGILDIAYNNWWFDYNGNTGEYDMRALDTAEIESRIASYLASPTGRPLMVDIEQWPVFLQRPYQGLTCVCADQSSDINTTTNVITFTTAPPDEESIVTVSSTGTLPGGLSAGTYYYTRDNSGNTCKLGTRANTFAGPPEATYLVDITSTGSGVLTLTNVTYNYAVPQLRTAADMWRAATTRDLGYFGVVPYDDYVYFGLLRTAIAGGDKSTIATWYAWFNERVKRNLQLAEDLLLDSSITVLSPYVYNINTVEQTNWRWCTAYQIYVAKQIADKYGLEVRPMYWTHERVGDPLAWTAMSEAQFIANLKFLAMLPGVDAIYMYEWDEEEIPAYYGDVMTELVAGTGDFEDT
jgi:hypothetical protein